MLGGPGEYVVHRITFWQKERLISTADERIENGIIDSPCWFLSTIKLSHSAGEETEIHRGAEPGAVSPSQQVTETLFFRVPVSNSLQRIAHSPAK